MSSLHDEWFCVLKLWRTFLVKLLTLHKIRFYLFKNFMKLYMKYYFIFHKIFYEFFMKLYVVLNILNKNKKEIIFKLKKKYVKGNVCNLKSI